jgi:hypothetical protein
VGRNGLLQGFASSHPTTQVVRKRREMPSVLFSLKFVRICGTSATPQLNTLMRPSVSDTWSRRLHTQSRR